MMMMMMNCTHRLGNEVSTWRRVLFVHVMCSVSSSEVVVATRSTVRATLLSEECYQQRIVNRILHNMNVMCLWQSTTALILWLMLFRMMMMMMMIIILMMMMMMMAVGNWSSWYYHHIARDLQCVQSVWRSGLVYNTSINTTWFWSWIDTSTDTHGTADDDDDYDDDINCSERSSTTTLSLWGHNCRWHFETGIVVL